MKTYTQEEFDRIYGKGAASQVGTPIDNETYGQRLMKNLRAGISQFKEAGQKISTAGTSDLSPSSLLKEGGRFAGASIEAGLGLGRAATSWLTAGLEPVFEPTVGRGFTAASEAISNIPQVQRFAESRGGQVTSDIAQQIANLAELAGYVIIPKPGIDAARSAATRVGSAVDDFTRPAGPAGRGTLPTIDSTATAVGGMADDLVPPPSAGVGAGLATTAATGTRTGLGGLMETAGSVGRATLGEVGEIPGRIATNIASRRALEESISRLPSQAAQAAARNGVDLADVTALTAIPATEIPTVRSLWQGIREFAAGTSNRNPVEIIGEPIIERLNTLQAEAKRIGSVLSDEAKALQSVTTPDLQPLVLNRLRQVPGLEGLTLGARNTLGFKNTILATAETAADRKAIQAIFSDAVKRGTGYSKHLLRQELFEALGGKKRAQIALTTTSDNAYEAIRRGLADALEQQSPRYKQLNQQYARIIQPVRQMAKFLTKAGKEEDLMNLSAGILARRITSNAISNPEIRNLLRSMDTLLRELGKEAPSVELLQDIYNILNRYYEIAPETGFQGQIQAGIESSTGLGSLIGQQARELAGVTPAVRKQAIENLLNDLLGGTPEGPLVTPRTPRTPPAGGPGGAGGMGIEGTEAPTNLPQGFKQGSGSSVETPTNVAKTSIQDSIRQAKASGQSFDDWIKEQGPSVYHGTKHQFDAFDNNYLGQVTGSKSAKEGFYFTTNKNVAEGYARFGDSAKADKLRVEADRLEAIAKKTNKSSDWDAYNDAYLKYEDEALTPTDYSDRKVIEARLDIQNPLVVDFKNKRFIDEDYMKLLQTAKKNKHDGLIIKNVSDAVETTYTLGYEPDAELIGDIYVPFDSKQIKTRSQLKAEWDNVKAPTDSSKNLSKLAKKDEWAERQKTSIKESIKNYDNLQDFLEAQQRERNVLYRGAYDDEVRNNAFFADFYTHAEDYAGGADAIASGEGAVVGMVYKPEDVLYFNNDTFNQLRKEYAKIDSSELKAMYSKPIKDGQFGNAQMAGDISDRQVIPLIKKLLKSDIPYSEISGNPAENDFLVPLMQKFAQKQNKNIIAFEGSDFMGATEYVVADPSKLLNLNEIWKQLNK